MQPVADSETEDVLRQLMTESMIGIEQRHAENGSDAVHALQSSQQIDVQSLFMDSGARVQGVRYDAGSDRTEQPSGIGNADVFSRSSSGLMGPVGATNMHADGVQPGHHAMLPNAGAVHSASLPDATDAPSAAASLNACSSSDSAHNQNAESSDLGGDVSSIWGSGGLGGAGRLAQDAPVSEVDWKMMREIWNRPSSSAEGVQQHMQRMQLSDSCIGSGQQAASHANANRFGNVQPQQLVSGHNVAGSSTGGEGPGDANAMKVLTQLWSSNSEPSASAQAPPHGKTSEQELSQQLMAFHQQHQQKQQAQRQAAANSSAGSTDQMLEHFYQPQRSGHAVRNANDAYAQAMARAGHGVPHMANHAYPRQGGKPVQQVGFSTLCTWHCTAVCTIATCTAHLMHHQRAEACRSSALVCVYLPCNQRSAVFVACSRME